MSKIRKSARGEDCSVRLPGVCNFNNETTILAHLPSNAKGIGKKSNDITSCYCCSDCHDVIDGRRKSDFSELYILIAIYDAMVETQLKLIDKGLIKIA